MPNNNENMIRNHIERIQHLETIQDLQTNTLEALTESFKAMTKQFNQMKWAAIGAMGFYVLSQIGLTEFLKRVVL